MRRAIPKTFSIAAGILFLFAAWLPAPRARAEDLPPLLLDRPEKKFDVLTPLGAGEKTLDEAQEQLRREGKKVDADAVFLIACENGGMGRDGLTFYHKDTYCKGLAIRFAPTPPEIRNPKSETRNSLSH